MEKKANHFHTETVLTQLHYTGMLDTIRLYKSGFPKNETFGDFFGR
jgi:myosin heavy subunit